MRVNHARIARAERGAQAIAEVIERFERDFGFLPAWRGPYLTAPPDADPWQNRYMVNMGAAVGRRGAAGVGTYALVVVSAGPTGIVETAYWQSTEQFRAGGDDIVVKVRRAGRQDSRGPVPRFNGRVWAQSTGR